MSTSEPTWWLCHEQITYGPFNHAYIAQALERGEFHLDVQACQVGTNEWKPLRAFNLWNRQVATVPDICSSTTSPSPGARKRQRLPLVAQLIAWYAMFAYPILTFLGNVSCLISEPTFAPESPYFGLEVLLALIGFPIDLTLVIVGFIGGLQLQLFRRRGRTLLLISLGASLAWVVVSLLISGFLCAVASADPHFNHFAPEVEHNFNAAAALLFLAMLVIFLSALVFHVFAFFWLLVKGNKLPLK